MIEPWKIDVIISGGQTGADRAGLDAGLKLGITIEGYCPKGRRSEDGKIPDCYPLMETTSSDYRIRTQKNVEISDGTLIMNMGKLSSGTALTANLCRKQNKPCLVVQVDKPDGNEEETIQSWLLVNRVKKLNVAGPRESKCPGIHDKALDLLKRALGYPGGSGC